MPSEKLLRLDPCLPRGPFVDHIPSFPRVFCGIRVVQGVLSLSILAILLATLVVRAEKGVQGEIVNGTVLVNPLHLPLSRMERVYVRANTDV